ncbi:hypothetical protein M9458_053187 [Cirrhinus mrigala]|uniref:BED-type domain-containing protein n=1 Tax=Cirrhinus mrigala TaxID=683832 RepID=A0ABD0MN55_CIRMR
MAEGKTARDIQPAPSHFKSKVWKHFGFHKLPGNEQLDMSKAVCKLCRILVTYCGNTTNMSAHLARHHPELNAKQPEKAEASASQRTLNETLYKLPSVSEKARRITESIAMFICKDIRPYAVVENDGFRNMIHTLEPHYIIPSRKFFSETVVPTLYNNIKSEVINSLGRSRRVALTCDAWTSRATESYVTVTAHHITDDWSLLSHVLQTRAMYESHTGANVAELLHNVVTEWNIAEKDPVLVTDNATNMACAAQLTGYLHVRCFAHTLNLASQRALKLPAVARLLGRIRRATGFFHRSAVGLHTLQEKQKLLDLPVHRLITDVSTRWNSVHDMVERFLEQQPAITAALLSAELRKREKAICTFTESDISNAEEFIQALKAMKVATCVLSDESKPTLSVIAPLLAQLLQDTQEKSGDPPFVKEIKEAVHQDLKKRYASDTEKATLNQAAALDPRFKALPFLSDNEKEETFARMVSEAGAIKELEVNNSLYPL